MVSSVLREITGGDEELLIQLLVDLKESLTVSVTMLREATDAEWTARAHRLKGGALAMGADDIARIAARAEETGPPDADGRSRTLCEIDKAFADFFAAV
ncbi:Hpt domain-containing protein [Pacificimonas flava]|uniref:HPt domain-containing protein n=1 Tax=Pacificimonas flava TaxID=1234595 RepID=M2TR75_9SPHN|nr:Hpt domain-containing protein [Pacificimonas flava]EMD84286.1 hypothetical protein C725_0216 [Pacificimonas flava]MBB5279838.1 HPt (histidine-containing phosphotransfer) domain-containing protein [Pacificimonas flava]